MNSGLNTLIHMIQSLIKKGHAFDWPENMSWTSDSDDRPFLSFLKEYVARDHTELENPVNVIRAFIRECKGGDYRLLERTGFCAELFQLIFMHPNMETFFKFCKPLISTTTRSSACSMCTIQPREGEYVGPESFIELKTIHKNLTLEVQYSNTYLFLLLYVDLKYF